MKKFARYLMMSACMFILHHVAGQDFNIHNPLILPDKSQQTTIAQKIGYTTISVNYHSPGAKGRTIWGELVPHGTVWRAGANENTVIAFTDAVQIEGQQLAAGSYGVHLLPEENQWTFIFSKNHTSWGSYFYDQAEDAIRVTVPVEKNDEYREWLGFDFYAKERAATTIGLSWGDRKASFKVSLDIDTIALDNIRKQLRSDAYWEWFSWCQAADYCAEYDINTKEALQWVDKSIQLQENFSNWDVKAKLLSQLGDTRGAQTAIDRAIEVGSPVYLERYGRRLAKNEEYKRAVAVFDEAIKKDGTFWRAYFNKAKALSKIGKNREAKKSFEKALENAPANRKKSIQSLLVELK